MYNLDDFRRSLLSLGLFAAGLTAAGCGESVEAPDDSEERSQDAGGILGDAGARASDSGRSPGLGDAAGSAGDAASVDETEVVVCPAPVGAPVTDRFSVRVEGQEAPVYEGPATENGRFYGFTSFDFSGGPARIEVAVSGVVLNAPVVRPSSKNVTVSVVDGVATLVVTEPGQYTLLPDGDRYDNALHVFANPPEVAPPSPEDPNVIYFGPGVHDAGRIRPADGQTVYLHCSAFVRGGVELLGVADVTVRGRGVIDGTAWEKWDGPTDYRYALFHFDDTHDCTLEGVVIRGSWAASAHVYSSRRTLFDNIKVVNSRFMNDDGLTPINTSDLTIRDSFVRTDDDCVPIKGYQDDREDVDGVLIERSVFWADRARVFLVGHETMVGNMQNITIRDNDVIHYSMTPFLIEPGEEGTVGPNVLFDDIRVHGDGVDPGEGTTFLVIQPVINQWLQLQAPGHVDGVTVRDIAFTGDHVGDWILIRGYDSTHLTQNVTVQRLVVDGRPLTRESPGVVVGDHTAAITIVAR
jgi:hypothetical protein